MQFKYAPRILRPHPLTLDNRGCIAFARGPFVYCAEAIDNPAVPDLRAIRIDEWPRIEESDKEVGFAEWGIRPVVLKVTATVVGTGDAGVDETSVTLIPTCLWSNRGKSDVRVWLPEHMPTDE